VLRNRALQIDIYLLTYVVTSRLYQIAVSIQSVSVRGQFIYYLWVSQKRR